MNGYISRNPDGRYVLSRWRPILATVYGTKTEVFYPLLRTLNGKVFGDGLWVSDLCPAHVEAHLKRHDFTLPRRGESVKFSSLAFLLE